MKMEVGNLVILISAIVLCFVLQTVILKIKISDSMEETQRINSENMDKIQQLSNEKMDRAAEALLECRKTSLQDSPILLDGRTEGDIKFIFGRLIQKEVEALADKMEVELQRGCQGNTVFATVSWEQLLWFVFAFLATCFAIVLNGSLREKVNVGVVMLTAAWSLLIVIFYTVYFIKYLFFS